jgi:hypothetical protein
MSPLVELEKLERIDVLCGVAGSYREEVSLYGLMGMGKADLFLDNLQTLTRKLIDREKAALASYSWLRSIKLDHIGLRHPGIPMGPDWPYLIFE